MILTIKTGNGYINELPNVELIAIDGVPYGSVVTSDPVNLEHRVRLLEQHVVSLMSFLDSKFPPIETVDGVSLSPDEPPVGDPAPDGPLVKD